MANSKQLGMKLKRLRQEKNLNQEKLAKRAKITRVYLSQLETGAKSPTIRILHRLACALEVPLVDLLIDREGWIAKKSLDVPVLRTRREAEAIARVQGSPFVWRLFEAGAVPRIRGPYPVRHE
ncbi:MAG: helix-turn-helix transcriptional regulator [Candidatus Rokubacteria bacterium]|nr:helix-turn-helix transcriptional regulator [Candidatus Rokubacteria bacterium]